MIDFTFLKTIPSVRRKLMFAVTLALFLFQSFFSFAQPANDNPCNATPITVNAACSFSSYTNVASTSSPGVPAPGCANYQGRDVWFSVTVPPGGAINFDSNTGTMFDGGMAVYSGTCNALTLLSCDDDNSANGLMPSLTVSGRPPGTTLFVRFWGYGNSFGTFQLCASIPPPPTVQDCPAAIPICQNVYSTAVSYSGTGNLHNEINPANSCLLAGERYDVWYTFTVQTSGNLNFTITPNNFSEDYDWAVYNLTNATCADIFSNPAIMVSCNFSGTGGNTGPTGAGATNWQNAGGTPFNAVVPVVAGQTYVVNVSNFSQSQNGYTINFGASTATIFDVIPPQMQSVNPLSCGASQLTLNFSENILCNTIQNADFTVTGPGGPYTITGWSSTGCNSGAPYDRIITINVSPAMTTSGNYQICLTNASGSVTDLCGNVAPPGCLNFTVNPITTTLVQVDVSCNGGANGSATVTPSGGTGPYVFSWVPNVGSTSTITNLTAGTYTATVTDAHGCSTTRTVTITQPAVVTAVISNQVNVSCNAGNNGTATVTAGGGIAPYTYFWSPSGGTGATATGLAAGNYTVTVTDSRGCTKTATVTITQPTLLTAVMGPSTDLNCNGVNTGSATVVPGGGTPAYTYAWTPSGGTGATATNLGAGNYTVTVTDARSCTATANVIIAQPPPLTAVINAHNNVGCFGAADGTATVVANGGNPGYTYAWVPGGATGSTATGLGPASYTVTVTDANGCQRTATVSITQPAVLQATIASTNPVCNGVNTGSATVTPTGGTGPYSFTWLPTGDTTATTGNLPAGSYTITVTDANGCTQTATRVVTEPPPITYTVASTQANCGVSNGTGSVTPSGGTPGYTYSWSPSGGSGASATNLAAGGYSVTIRDANNCTEIAIVAVSNTAGPTLTVVSSTDASCSGGANGSATVSASGGAPPYTYSWAPTGGTGTTATGLTAGNYSITVLDANGCSATRSVTINEPNPLIAAISNSTDVTCAGGNNGSASVLASGGTPGYTYSWSPGGGNGTTANSLPAGNYSVTVTDAHGCTDITSVPITQPSPLTSSILNPTNVTCNGGDNGTATVTVNGGTAPYTFSWTPGGGTGTIATGLAPGTYTVHVTDDVGCTSTSTVLITQPAPLVATISASTNISCDGLNNGSATVTGAGGTVPYSYSWSPSGGTGATASGLAPGIYTVVITDANGCTDNAATIITEPPPLSASIAPPTNILCNGGNNGSAIVTAGGGTAGYTYVWLPSGGTSNSALGLTAGNYTVTVTDAHGCTQTASTTITQPAIVTAVISPPVNVSCNGGSDGAATVTAGGGVPGYTYSWSPSGGNGITASGLTAGNYTVTVTDANGCTSTATVTISQPAPITLTPSSVNALCGNPTGQASVVATGGTPGYTYDWSPSGGTSSTATGLFAGSYQVDVMDSHGCPQHIVIGVGNSGGPVPVATVTSQVSCNGGSNGSAQVAISSGAPPYFISWSPIGGSNATANNLPAGSYTVSVIDANGCNSNDTITIVEPTAILLNPSSTNVNCNGGTSGSASVTASGGTPGYTYAWSPGGGTSATVNGLTAGNYTVTITDAHACTQTATTVITQPTALTAVIPAPTNVNCNGGNNGAANVNVNGGTPGYTYVWSPSGGTTVAATGLVAGNYSVTVTDARGCTQTASTTITQPTPLTAVIPAPTNVSCNGGNNGSATVNANGGTAGYAYVWSSGVTTATASGLTAGNYTVTVTDAHGCTRTASTTITQPAVLTANVAAPTNVSCNGGNNGSATVNAGGGTAGYTYAWLPSGGTGATASGLTAGNYTVTVTDAHGCTLTATTNVTQPNLLTAVIPAPTNVSCNGGNNGSATVTPGGGTPIYTFAWSPSGGTGATATGLTAGNYTVTVTDAHGCTLTATTNITQPNPLTAVMPAPTNVSCNGGNNGSATVNVNGGTPAYTYAWAPSGGTGVTASNLVAGSYSVNITDARGCTATAGTIITQPTLLTATIPAPTNVSCNGGNNGSATVTAGGGTPGYTYTWSPTGGTGATASGLTAGNYTLTVTDARGCTQTASTTISQPTPVTATISAPTNVSCNGGNNGSLSVNAGGGTAGYSYNWTPSGGTTASATGLTAGNYTVTVTDSRGCTQTASALISQPNPLVALIPAPTNVSCNAGNNGSATVNVNGGTAAYTYSWFPIGGTNATANNLVAGVYSVNITDAHGCTTTANTNITQPSAITLQTASTPALCGTANGTASVVAGGGSPGYTYSWSPSGGTGANAAALAAGAYTVTVTDAHGCQNTGVANIANTGGPTATASVVANVSCHGGNNGSASVTIAAGSPPFSIAWAPAGGTNALANNLTAGNFTVTITDANGCVSSDNVSISEPTALVANTSKTNALCNASTDGTASVLASGGTAPYSYSWSPSGGTAATATGLAAGNYSVTVTDSNNCSVSSPALIGQPAPLNLVMSSIPALCNGSSDGSASVVVTGGTSGYSYSWSPLGGTASTASGIPAGNYTLTLTDAHSCTSSNAVVVAQPSLIGLVTASSPATCGASNGSASVVASGGSTGYTYAWSPSGGTNANATGLVATAYTVTVTDAHGCQNTAIANVANSGGPTATANVTSNVTCHGGNNGSASVVISSGVAPFSIAWNPSGGTNAVATNLSAGNYSVNVTDANGCVSADNVSISEPAALVLNTSKTDALCNGSNDGTASVIASGGIAPYSYAWSPSGGTAAAALALSAGNYTITVTDSNGCSQSAPALVGQPAPLILVMAASPAQCNGSSDGSASVAVNGGTIAYSYSWSSGQTTSAAAAVTAGNYTVTVTDAHSCSSFNSVAVAQPAAISLVTASSPATCGASNGSVSVVAGGGSPAYSYSWSPGGATSANVPGLAATAYIVTVTDAHGCQNTAAANVANSGGPTATASVVANVSCHGGNNGAASVNISSGVAPFSILWNPSGATSALVNNLSAGNHTVNVTDANGCVSSNAVLIAEPALLVVNASATDALCNGASDGAASVLASGGVTPYSYAWSPSGGTAASALALSAGNYTITVTDSNGCSQSAPALVGQPAPLNLVMAASPALCNGSSDGSTWVAVTGGTLSYSYSWSSGQTTSSASAVTAGNYTVTVTDTHNCSSSNSVAVAQPAAINLVMNASPATCGAANGSASVLASGGSPGYSYSWSPGGATSANVPGLPATSYTVTVTDAHGCQNTAATNVANTGGPTTTVTISSNVTCNGGNNGSATVNISAGVAPFNILWTPSGGTNTVENNLTAGNYSVNVTDANGCVSSNAFLITEPALLVANATGRDALCNASADGSALVVASGGIAPYSYAWAPSGGTAASAPALPAGNYSVTVTDSNGCSQIAAALVSEPPPLNLVMASSPALCNGSSDGSAWVAVTGGTLSYSYSWSSGQTTSTAAVLAAGNYTVTVTDAHSCSSSNSIAVAQPAPINLVTNVSPSTCGAANGSAAVVATGGSPGYSYVWAPGGATSASVPALTAASYTVTVTDAHGCQNTAIANVPNTGGPTATASVTSNVSCHGGSNGSAMVNIALGSPPFTIVWSTSGGTSVSANSLAAGTYAVTVTDANGCISSDNVSISEPTALAAVTSKTDALCNGSADGSAAVIASGGTSPYSYAWLPLGGTAATASSLAAGNYSVTITDANACSISAAALVGQPAPLNLVMASSPALCNGSSDGSAWVAVSGGTSGYSYSWSPMGGTAATASGLAAGNYTVTVNDAHACSSSSSVALAQPTLINILVSMTPALCNGSSDGSATAIASGGTFPYQYQWSPTGGNAMTASSLHSGNYSVVVSDDHGCSQSAAIAVTAPPSLALATSTTATSCYAGSDGTATVTPNGGTQPYQYAWSPSGGTLDVATGLATGNYSVLVSDLHGCSASTSAFVTQPTPVSFSVAGNATICYGQSTSVSASPAGGTAPYFFQWSNGNTAASQTVTPSITTVYTVSVLDDHACSAPIQSVTVTVTPPLSVAALATPVICEGDQASISAIASGGNGGPYTYSWNNAAITGSAATVFPTHDSSFVVVAADGCTTPAATDSVSVHVNPLPKVAFLPHLIEGCTPVQANFLNYTITPPGSAFLWDMGDNTLSSAINPSHTYTIPGHYTVSLIVQSPQGCSDNLTVPNAVTVYGLPEARFIQSTDLVSILNSTVEFTDNSIDAVQWIWNFGDASPESYLRNPVHQYRDTGSYQIELIVASFGGCLDTSYGRLRVEDEFAIYIPNAFTPNGDGVNDGFIALGVGYTDYDMWIIDRWGKEIFHSTSKTQPWDGSYYSNNTLCQNDVYEYVIKVLDKNGKERKFIGHVTLVR